MLKITKLFDKSAFGKNNDNKSAFNKNNNSRSAFKKNNNSNKNNEFGISGDIKKHAKISKKLKIV